MLSYMSLLAISMYTFVAAGTGLMDYLWILLGWGGTCTGCTIYN